MLYNQQIATTSEMCVVAGSDYCLQWEKETITTYQWFDTIFILIKIAFGIIIVLGVISFRKK